MIAVAGTDHSDHRMEALYDFNGVWVNSSYGDWVDIAAPGENIFTTSPSYHVTSCDTWGYELNYDMLSGTTLAAPVVAGVAGLVFSKNPEYSPDKVAAILKANSDPYDSPYYLGMGRVNAYKALMELNAEPEKPAAPEGTTSGKVGNHYNYTVSTVYVEGDQLYYYLIGVMAILVVGLDPMIQINHVRHPIIGLKRELMKSRQKKKMFSG